jgi:hypothetical protein
MFDFYLKTIIVLLIVYYFYKKHKPKVKFLFLGIFFFGIAFLISFPFKVLFQKIIENFSGFGFYLSNLVVLIFFTIFFESSKYFALKKYLKTRSFKNGVFFVIGWSGVETLGIFNYYLINFLKENFNVFVNTSNFAFNLNVLDFLFYLLLNLAISVLVVISIIKKKKIYFFYGLIFSILTIIFLNMLNSIILEFFLKIIISIYSLYIIFKFNKIK